MGKPRGKDAKRQAVRKQQLRDESVAKRAKGSPSALSHSHLPEVLSCPLPIQLPFAHVNNHVVFDAADDVLSEELMGGNSGNTGSALALGELPRVVQVVVCSPSLSCLHIPLCLPLSLCLQPRCD